MNEDRFKHHHCERKKRYSSKEKALRVLKKLRKRGYIIPASANAYHCKYCGKWHLGHKQEN